MDTDGADENDSEHQSDLEYGLGVLGDIIVNGVTGPMNDNEEIDSVIDSTMQVTSA